MMRKLVCILIIVMLLLSCLATFIYSAYFTLYKPSNIILMYHSIQPEPLNKYEDLYVSPDDLENQFKIITESGISTNFITDINNDGIYITFDDGYEDNYTLAFPLIQKYQIKVTIFMITGYIGEDGYLNEDQIREMTDSGLVSIQCHTVTHSNLTELDETQLYYELIDSKIKLESITGQPVNAISYPYGKYNSEVIAIASQVYTVGVTTKGPNAFTDTGENLTKPRYGIPRIFDISTFVTLIQD